MCCFWLVQSHRSYCSDTAILLLCGRSTFCCCGPSYTELQELGSSSAPPALTHRPFLLLGCCTATATEPARE